MKQRQNSSVTETAGKSPALPFRRRLSGFVFPACAALLSTVQAGPVTTVPWNGKTGAVSFTYDDARNSHVPNLMTQLDSVGVKATFFVCETGVGGSFTPKLDGWLAAARKGHEIANHTQAHTNITDGNAAATVKGWADHLRGLDSTIESVTFAYPNCSYPGNTGYAGVGAENFIARGCHTSSSTNYAWGSQPSNWMRVDALIMSPSNNSTGISLLNNSRNQNRWAVILIHDVASPTPDQYSVTPANNLQLLNTAISNGMWVDTYQNIGAYWRAHFTMDTAQAVQDGVRKRVQWVSPHPKMPKRVPLRVKLDKAVFGDSAVVMQDGAVIPREADSSYVIDFMKLSLDVYPPGSVGVVQAGALRRAAARATLANGALTLEGLPVGAYAVEVRDARGALAGRFSTWVAGKEAQVFAFERPLAPGLYQVTLRSGAGETRRLPALSL